MRLRKYCSIAWIIGSTSVISQAVTIMPAFTEEFSSGSSNKTTENFFYGSGGKKADFTWLSGQKSVLEPSTEVLRLTMDPADKNGAWTGPNMTSNSYCHFGTYSARIKIPSVKSQPNVGGVVGFYTYYNDAWSTGLPADINQNGMKDNSEIDFEWLIADPQVIYITAYTDYDDATGKTKKVARTLNLAKGTIYQTNYAETLGGVGTKLTGAENTPSEIAAIPDFDASKQFYTYGFDWKPDQIRWWLIHPSTNDTVVLWDYRGPQERITQKEASIMLNIWHTNDWPVITNSKSTEIPKDTFSVEFDRITYTPLGASSIITPSNSSSTNKPTIVREASSFRVFMEQSGNYNAEIYSFKGTKLKSIFFTGKSTTIPVQVSPTIIQISEANSVIATVTVPSF